MVITRDEPPKEMNGSGMPVTGRTPITAPTLITVSAGDPGDQGDGQQATEAVRGPGGRPQAEPGEGAEEEQDGDGTDQARAPPRSPRR